MYCQALHSLGLGSRRGQGLDQRAHRGKAAEPARRPAEKELGRIKSQLQTVIEERDTLRDDLRGVKEAKRQADVELKQQQERVQALDRELAFYQQQAAKVGWQEGEGSPEGPPGEGGPLDGVGCIALRLAIEAEESFGKQPSGAFLAFSAFHRNCKPRRSSCSRSCAAAPVEPQVMADRDKAAWEAEELRGQTLQLDASLREASSRAETEQAQRRQLESQAQFLRGRVVDLEAKAAEAALVPSLRQELAKAGQEIQRLQRCERQLQVGVRGHGCGCG
jgi:DNA repair exonuclease SbcCD ATPase subunit